MPDSRTDENGRHPHTNAIKEQYPEPLSYILIELAELNREKWLSGPREKTIGADAVRETGLTSNEQAWADELAEKLADREEWACDECGENMITATVGVNGPGRCNDCIFGDER